MAERQRYQREILLLLAAQVSYKRQWGQAPLNFYKIINLDIRTIEIVY